MKDPDTGSDDVFREEVQKLLLAPQDPLPGGLLSRLETRVRREVRRLNAISAGEVASISGIFFVVLTFGGIINVESLRQFWVGIVLAALYCVLLRWKARMVAEDEVVDEEQNPRHNAVRALPRLSR